MEEKTANSFRILSLSRTDYTASLHTRAMAKLLNTSHMTLIPHIKKLEQHKILQPKKEGRNKQYTLNKDNILTKHHLTITKELTTIAYLKKQ